ncbi:Deoxyribonuclease gamma [Anabarilius grahami]|uniref:Deoxyribonuclease gamma n=1 Tax=Anabarilius grahami TaxID=495550 RepID=A0A3N0XDW0_ANAGA|nr:Deoxyribonuclease gamma [Anabarilius grahami]
MDPATQLVSLRQGTRTLEVHIQNFLDIAHLSDLPDCALIDFFGYGLNEPLKTSLLTNGPRRSFMEFLDFALLAVGSTFTVGVAEDSDATVNPVMADIITTTPVYVCADRPEQRLVSADRPEQRHVSADRPEQRHVSADRPEQRHSIIRCDLMLVLEIKDAKGKAFDQLMTHLNSKSRSRADTFSSVISERLGRKTYKEQYAFIYRQKMLSVKAVYQYPDTQTGDEDAFAREPFVVWFSAPNAEIKDFVIIPIHTVPEAAVKEIDELYDVYQNVSQLWQSDNFIIMGDFNAACGYVPKRQWVNIRLRSESEFVWLTGDKLDTSVKASTKCAYDRVVLRGEKMIAAVSPESVEVFNFKDEFGLTEQQALAVSDHFPLCITVNQAQRRG